MIVITDGYYKQCSSIPSCVVGLSELRSHKGTGKVRNLVEIFPICAHVDFFSREEPGGAIGYVRYRRPFWFNYFYVSVPFYKRINAVRDYLEEVFYRYYPRKSYDRICQVEKNFKKGYALFFRGRGNDCDKKLLVVYDSLKSARKAISDYYSSKSEFWPEYFLGSFSISRLVISLSNPIALFGHYNGYRIGFWWCRLFLTFLQGNSRPKDSAHVFFHHELDPDKNEIRYQI